MQDTISKQGIPSLQLSSSCDVDMHNDARKDLRSAVRSHPPAKTKISGSIIWPRIFAAHSLRRGRRVLLVLMKMQVATMMMKDVCETCPLFICG